MASRMLTTTAKVITLAGAVYVTDALRAPPLYSQVVSRERVEHVYELRRLFFSEGSAEVSKAGVDQLSEVAEALRSGSFNVIDVVGHSDCHGSAASNEQLSRERAAVAAQSLVALGVPSDRVRMCWYGEMRPFVEALDRASRRWNRRVDLLLASQPNSITQNSLGCGERQGAGQGALEREQC